MERLTGFDAQELAGETIEGLGLALPVASQPDEGAGSDEPRRLEFTLVTSDWRKLPVVAEISEIRLAGVRCQFGVVREVMSTSEVSTHHTEDLIRAITRNSHDALIVLGSDGTIRHISQGLEQVLGWQIQALRGRSIVDFVAPEDYAVVQPFSTGGVIHAGEIEGIRMLQDNGELRTVNLTIADLAHNPLVDGWIVVVKAPSNTVLHQTKRLGGGGYYSLYDPVTALPNRLLFIDRLDHAIERSARVHSVMCCLAVAIEDFERATQGYDADIINHVFCEFSRRLHQTVREGDTVARIGDDEFAILAEGVGGAAEARVLGERVGDALREPFETPRGALRLKANVGAAVSSPSGQNAGNLLRDALTAVEHARKVGAGRAIVFEDRMRGDVIDSLKLEGDLEGAHMRDELQVFYQPEVDIHTEKIVAVEALVRWEHPRHGRILPGEFLALAEETGQLHAIGLWTIERVCETVQEWRRRHPAIGELVGVVNLAAQQIQHQGFADRVFAILDRTGLPPANLRLEVSEARIGEIEHWVRAAHVLRAAGIGIGLQNANPADLNSEMLASLPISTIKVDRTATGAIIEDPARPSRSKPLAQFAVENGLNVVVSGIETAQQLARARILGYHNGQGFYFYRPVPPQTIEYLMMRNLPDTTSSLRAMPERAHASEVAATA
jgi:diguanylate cyclase (GGDEF)-like protein/PAS domain S-box-containing protein